MMRSAPTGASGSFGGSDVLVPPPVPGGGLAVLVDLGLSVFFVVWVADGVALGSGSDSELSWCATTLVLTPPAMLIARMPAAICCFMGSSVVLVPPMGHTSETEMPGSTQKLPSWTPSLSRTNPRAVWMRA